MTFLALHNYLGLTTELFNCVSLGCILFAVVMPVSGIERLCLFQKIMK